MNEILDELNGWERAQLELAPPVEPDPTVAELNEAVRFARARLSVATDEMQVRRGSLCALRAKMVAEDELRSVMAERRRYESQHDVQCLRQLDMSGARRLRRR